MPNDQSSQNSKIALTEIEKDVLEAVAVSSQRTVRGVRLRAMEYDTTDARLAFREALLSLNQKLLVSLPDGSLPNLADETSIDLTDAGSALLDAAD